MMPSNQRSISPGANSSSTQVLRDEGGRLLFDMQPLSLWKEAFSIFWRDAGRGHNTLNKTYLTDKINTVKIN